MFVIKVHKEATKNNFNFKGVVNDYYYGKGQLLIGDNVIPAPRSIVDFAYSTKAAAVKGLKVMQANCNFENEFGYWNCTCELVEVDM